MKLLDDPRLVWIFGIIIAIVIIENIYRTIRNYQKKKERAEHEERMRNARHVHHLREGNTR